MVEVDMDDKLYDEIEITAEMAAEILRYMLTDEQEPCRELEAHRLELEEILREHNIEVPNDYIWNNEVFA